MSSKTNDTFHVYLNVDGESYTNADSDLCAVLLGDWSRAGAPEDVEWVSDDDEHEDELFLFHVEKNAQIKEVLFLDPNNLLKIREKMPELWLKWKTTEEETEPQVSTKIPLDRNLVDEFVAFQKNIPESTLAMAEKAYQLRSQYLSADGKNYVPDFEKWWSDYNLDSVFGSRSSFSIWAGSGEALEKPGFGDSRLAYE